MRAVARNAVVIGLLAARASADDEAGPPHSLAARVAQRIADNQPPLLILDASPRAASEGVDTARQRAGRSWQLGPSTRLAAEGQWWESSLSPQTDGPRDRAVLSQGWQAAAQLSHDLGPFRLAVDYAHGGLANPFQYGEYDLVGISATRAFRLSPSLPGWISLAVTHRTWTFAPLGESDDTTVMLRIGMQFP